ncbi:MAG: translation initiation factor IF-2 [Patescibacteria group bacterium]
MFNESEKNENNNKKEIRPPIVVIIGHVDHGKTSLLDYIRKTNVAAKEAGGITQSIGAYEINHSSAGSGQAKKITFIDTPGHEAFSKMRARGAKIADLAILVVAADDGVKPQTKESIEILNATSTPFIVAINKIDKSNIDLEKTKNDLMQAGVLLEGFGGNISWQAISAKTGEGINELLDLALLAAEIENLTYNPATGGKGVVIESKKDNRKGITAVVIVKDGVLRIGDDIATSTAVGKVKILENFLGERVSELSPSSPALILGFDDLPQVGEEFLSGKVELMVFEPVMEKEKIVNLTDGESVRLSVVLKADVGGSLETLKEIIGDVKGVKIVDASLGEITDGDVKIASITGSEIFGFKVKIAKAAEAFVKAQGVKIIVSEIIYDLLKRLEEETVLGGQSAVGAELEILAVFSNSNPRKQVVGGRVSAGELKNRAAAEIFRNGEEIGKGKIVNLQHQKNDVGAVPQNKECGLLFEADAVVNVGDKLVTRL